MFLYNDFFATFTFLASSSSSVGLLGSPKPEKRQANSPLPPPPLSSSPDNLERLPIRSIDDMYAKVQKNRKISPKDDSDLHKLAERSSIRSNKRPSSNIVSSTFVEETNTVSKLPDESFTRKEHDYETLKKQHENIPQYERLKGEEPGYASINGPDSFLSVDPGYEVLKQQSGACSDSDPNYEELRHKPNNSDTLMTTDDVPGYSIINKQKKIVNRKVQEQYSAYNNEEPNYESMPSESPYDHNYAALKSTDSESDPNYESVNHNDPNYESVKYMDLKDNEPPYERLTEDDSSQAENSSVASQKVKKSSSNCGYETISVNKLDNSTISKDGKSTELPYKRLHEEEENGKTDSESSGYEKIGTQIGNQLPDYETLRPRSSPSSNEQSKSDFQLDTISKEKSGTSTSEDLQNSDEEIFEV